ncbi:MAG: thioesterase family protein [Agriterribacter sp.]
MARVKIDLPEHFSFKTVIPIRITDINYGGHAGNDSILSIIHEARMQFLQQHGCTEKNFFGAGLIMSDVAIEFKKELFYGDTVQVSVTVMELEKIRFDIVYRLDAPRNGGLVTVATARTGMVCFNYDTKRVVSIPEEAKKKGL